ncbi:class I SAM-dependent methyltransferase [Dictyobacter formicarum]|uniref:Methyltransferase type 11 domain-containing protein n=1 Tax=Dictyobacter formicarum TaxID=2778368 RepID=A0ABQ3VT92_9CHLR|nr:class I SAM-dependent methyltransferase [Dictyobacter formicarum]GHO82431.1 hypothetical protein KSZ_04370 [Dictyobacter formicarum]GHO89504.1 hypothetical protein KSZ_75100 [Dictyobacter formicarum]
MDNISQHNQKRWNALAGANALFSRPALELDAKSAQGNIDPEGRLGSIRGKQVLCLASGGGQQSAAFALLGAEVTVLDIAEGQLARDQQVAEHYHVAIKTVQGDMRDLSAIASTSFDIVWHPYSLNFVPDARAVFHEVARVLHVGGIYHMQCANPFTCGLTPKDWNGNSYSLKYPYIEGMLLESEDQPWAYARENYHGEPIPILREYRHTLSSLINGLSDEGFVLQHLSEDLHLFPNGEAEPGTWDHFVAYAPPWFGFWATYCPRT